MLSYKGQQISKPHTAAIQTGFSSIYYFYVGIISATPKLTKVLLDKKINIEQSHVVGIIKLVIHNVFKPFCLFSVYQMI